MSQLLTPPAIPAKIQVLKTIAMTLAVMAKSTNDPDLRIAASEEERDVKQRIMEIENTEAHAA
jgi:hypothetical protein